MTDPMFVVGRVALHGVQYVITCRYFPDSNYCDVIPLVMAIVYGENLSGKSYPVLLTELTFGQAKFFMNDSSERVAISGSSCPVDDVPSGAILDLAIGGVPLGMSSVWTITKACRIVGATCELTEIQRVKPVLRLCGEVHVSVVNEVDIVEFEDIFFDCIDCESAVQCKNGANIIFRRCRFRAEDYGVMVTSCTDGGTTSVTFESCYFKSCAQAGIFANGVCQVFAINCRFVECSTAIMVANGGSVQAKHCSIANGKDGVVAVYKGANIDLEQCSFRNCTDSGVNIGFSGSGTIARCFITECGRGFEITGPQRTTARIGDCVSESELSIECGKVDVMVSRSTISKQAFIKWDVVGNIDFENCDINKYHIWSSTKCIITVDNVPLAPRPLIEIEARVAHQRANEDLPLFYLRRLKKAGVSDVNCYECRTVEPRGVLFRKCARCKKVCYCSRDCQVKHWSLHQRSCSQELGPELDDET